MKPGKPLKARKYVTYGTADDRLAFKTAISGLPCAACGLSALAAAYETGHGHQAHHAIEQAYLKRHGLTAHLWDPRNAVALCEEPCHRRHTSRKRPLTWEELPDAVKDFADALGLIDYLHRTYPSA